MNKENKLTANIFIIVVLLNIPHLLMFVMYDFFIDKTNNIIILTFLYCMYFLFMCYFITYLLKHYFDTKKVKP